MTKAPCYSVGAERTFAMYSARANALPYGMKRPGPHLLASLKTNSSRAPMAHIYNPSYSGGREQEDHGSDIPGKQFMRPYLENTHHKKGWGSGSK
jgi:hypothetical protein